MLKGVHHQILEIRQTDNPFFERALLFVRVGSAEEAEDVLHEEGKRFLNTAKPYTGLRRNRWMRRLRYAACLVSGVLAGVVCGLVLPKIG